MADAPPDVTVIGAGIAGMTAALKLLESGLTVEVLEASSGLGGKFGARYANGGYHDFAWHVLAEWCENFWDVARSIGVDREQDFTACPRLTLLRPRGSSPPRGATIQDVSSPDFFWSNVASGVAHWSDLMLFAYSLFTLECDASINDEGRALRKEFLNRIPVNAYMRSLPHVSDIAALLHNELLLRIWGAPSYIISARSYQTCLRLVGAHRQQSAPVVLKENFEDAFWRPFLQTMTRRFPDRFTLALDTRLLALRVGDDRRVHEIVVQSARDGGPRAERVRRLLIAIPPEPLFTVVNHPESAALRQYAPDLLDLRKLQTQQTASLTLAFKPGVHLPGLDPTSVVTLIDDYKALYAPDAPAMRNGLAAKYSLSFVDIGWLRGLDRTVFSVLASEADPFGGIGDGEAYRLVLDQLQEHLDFTADDVDTTASHLQVHREERLFLNTVGSWEYRPEVRLTDGQHNPVSRQIWTAIPNLYLAGDYCRSEIDIASLEGAIHTAMWAAHAITRDERAAGRGDVACAPEPRRPAQWPREEAESIRDRLARWAPLAGRRAQLVADDLRAEATASPGATRPRSDGIRSDVSPNVEHDGGTTMSSRLSTHPAFGHPVPAIDWLAPYVNAAQVTLPSGAKVPMPMLFWRSRALVLYGLADADAVDGTALHDTGRTAARLDPAALGLPHGGSKALVQIWAPDYTGTTVGPIKAVFGSIIVVPTRKEFALLPHNWWWWYYGNSIVNQEFKREVWGVPNKIGMFDMFYDRPQKVVRLLEDGYVALRLECDLSHVTGEMDVTAPPDPAAPGGPPKPLPFRTVARRKTDDSENLVEILGRKLLGSSPLTMIPYQEGRDTFYCAPGATVGRALRDIDFTPVMWDFFTEYAGVVHLYDRHGRGEPATEDRDHQIAETIAQAIADALRHLPKP